MAQESQLSHLSEFQSNLSLHPFLSGIFFYRSLQSFHLFRITFFNGNSLSVANPASTTILFHTGKAGFFFEASLIFLPEKLSIHPCFDKRPRKGILEFSLSGVAIHLQSFLLKGLFPQGILELITPAIEATSQPKGLQ